MRYNILLYYMHTFVDENICLTVDGIFVIEYSRVTIKVALPT